MQSAFPAQALCLELTESQAMTEAPTNIRNLRKLRALGVGISIDDFGTGYSSLSQLHRLPATEVKIDRPFTRHLGTDSASAFVAGIVGLGHGMGIRVVAEGVETLNHFDALRAVGCHRAQGYLFGKPLDPLEFVTVMGSNIWLASSECPAALYVSPKLGKDRSEDPYHDSDAGKTAASRSP